VSQPALAAPVDEIDPLPAPLRLAAPNLTDLTREIKTKIVLAVCVLFLMGVALAGATLLAGLPVSTIAAVLVTPAIVACDLRSRLIPDALVLPALGLTLLSAALVGGEAGLIASMGYTLGVLGLLGALWLLGPDQMMGLGDVMLSALYTAVLASLPGAHLGPVMWGVIIGPAALAFVPALLAHGKTRPLPYAPFLAIGFILTALAPGLVP
jgi:prepilin signal peptidase PulO-like enzyme (type II secretory pathway)